MYHKIKDEIKVMNNEEGGYNPGHLWKLKQKLSPRHSEPITAMKDANGNLLTSEEDIKAETLKHYKIVFTNNNIDNEYKHYEINQEKLCQKRLEDAYQNKTPTWTLSDVQIATKGLNKGISKDPYGHPNELFQEGVAGDGLLRAVVVLMNKLKENPQEYPASMEICNVTSIYKNKGDRNSFNSYRGVFRTTSLRNIID